VTAIALLSVAPVTEGSMAGEVAEAVAALDAFDVAYETNPMGTVVEADDAEELFAAAAAAHAAVDGDRVSTFLKVDDKRTSEASARAKVDRVETELGREARRERPERSDPRTAGDERPG
jgi:uncharacterized protein YqgV (UPF0045/DUF77 family)